MLLNIIQTSKYTEDRLSVKEAVEFYEDKDWFENKLINVYEDVEYQEIEGFGGSFTEAAAVTLNAMSPKRREEIIEAYFDIQKGIGYNLCRTHINSSDFSTGNYAYVEDANDIELKSFNIERERKSIIPFIKDAMKVRGENIKLFSSPWSPPAWMKSNGKMNEGGKLKDEYREVWAKYYSKYIQAYAAEGINIWGLTIQNEPKATQTWDSCIYTAEEERDFVKNYLGPVLNEEGLSHVKVMVWDHNKESVYERAKVILTDTEAAKYIWGIGFHWYSGDHFEALDAVHQKYPNKKLIHTEGCRGISEKGIWDTGERYGHDIIGDLNTWTTAWVDWNLLLNEEGGPNHVANYCDAPIIADTQNDKIMYESSYYYIGHFSKYIKPGAKRIGCSRYNEKLETVAFKNPNGEIAVIIMNRTEEKIEFNIKCSKGLAQMTSLPRSIMTLLY